MKANKAIKRIDKIETLISDFTKRYAKGAVQVRAALQDAKAAFARLKEAASLHASATSAKKSAPKKAAKKSALAKKAAKKTAVKKTAPAPLQTTTEP
jgi:methionyl-tRNA synthetase